ncbi:MAG: hypothetical protein VX527_03215 [Planctomycetota bacterium]|nr:hypothetical protein [Planctomycetota bacterium]
MSDKQSNTDFLVVERCSSQFAAHALVALLADYGIKANVSDAGPYVLSGMVQSSQLGRGKPVFPVLVPASQFELARLTIQDARADASVLDWEQVDLGERTDRVPLTNVPSHTPLWLQGVAIAGLILLGLTVVGVIIMFVVWS